MKENKEDFIKLREAGVSYKKIGEIYGVSRQRVHQIVADYCSPATLKSGLDAREMEILRGKNREDVERYLENRKIEREKKVRKALKEIVGKDLLVSNIGQITGMYGGTRDRIRELVRIRDEHTCQICGKVWEEGKRRFDVHHNDEKFDGKTFILSVDELDRKNHNKMITLCHKCHLNLPMSTDKMKAAKLKVASPKGVGEK